jgi:apolipoprotein N-acyltransferase
VPPSQITLPSPQSPAPALRPSPASSEQHKYLWLRTFLLPLMTAGLLWLCYFPAACGWLAWIALVPLLGLVRLPARPYVLYLSAWLSGLIFHLTAMQWLRVADPRMYFTWIGLAFYCSLYFPLALYLIRFLECRTSMPLILTVPVVWTALELLRSTFGGGFSWYLLGHSQHAFLPLIQIADLTGAYGVSFLVAAVNALVFEILWRAGGVRPVAAPNRGGPAPRSPKSGRMGLLAQGLAVLAALLGTTIYGFWRLGQDRLTPGPRIALIQGNLDQRLRNATATSTDAVGRVERHFTDLSDVAALYRPDLIVWPETSWPYEWKEKDGSGPTPEVRAMAKDMAERWRTNLLIGMNGATAGADGRSRRYNSAILVDRQGQRADRYDKIHRVPFGEYVPFRDWLPWMNYFAPYDFDYSVWPGEQHTRFPLIDSATGRRFTFGVLICYEDTDAEVAHPYGGGGTAVADFLLNISNDGWFDGTSEHDEHLAVCRFRAVECRRAVARGVNMGISAVIDSNGRVLQPQELPRPDPRIDPEYHVWLAAMKRGEATELPVSQWHEYKKVAGVLLAIVPIDDRVSLYARWGDWLPGSCWLLIAGVFGFALVRRFGRAATSRSTCSGQP